MAINLHLRSFQDRVCTIEAATTDGLSMLLIGTSVAPPRIDVLTGQQIIVAVLESSGVNISVFIAGSAALLVGLGLGLQTLFQDIISGIFILSISLFA